MPNFIFPLLYRNKAIAQHKIVNIQQIDNQLITAGQNGELIIWEDLMPITLIYPNLSNAHGEILTIKFIRVSLYGILDRAADCLLVLYEDRRLRLFDRIDGRCLSVSPHQLLDQCNDIVPLYPKNCRFVLLSSPKGLQLLDLWKMDSPKELQLQVKAFCYVDINTVAALNSDNILHLINLSPLNNDRYYNFIEYTKKKAQVKQEFLEFKLNDGLTKQKLDGLTQTKKIRNMSYNHFLQHLTILTYKQAYLIFEMYQTPYYIQIIQSKNNYKFDRVHYTEDCIYIITKNGGVLPLLTNDILYLLQITKEKSDFVYGFKEFQFTKVAGSNMSRLQINFQEIIKGNGIQKDINGLYIDEIAQYVYQYNNHNLTKYLITKNIELNLFQEKETEIKFNGLDKYFNTDCSLIQIDSINCQNKIEWNFNFLESYNDDLLWNLKNMVTQQFIDKYFDKLQLQQKIITSAFIGEEKQIYYFGCQDGYIYGFPMIYEYLYPIYTYKMSEYAIMFLYQKGKYLIGSAQDGKFIIVDTETLQIPKQSNDVLIQHVDIIPLQSLLFPSYAKKILRIHKLENESFEKDSNDEYRCSNLGILMENNVILIICLNTGIIIVRLHGIALNQQVMALYHEEQADYWFAVLQNGESFVYDYKGRYMRSVNVEQYHSLFQVSQKLENCQKRMVSYHELSDFKSEFNKSISETYLLLEFEQRNNYVKMNSLHPSLYEVGGTVKQWTFEPEQSFKMLQLIDTNVTKNNSHICKCVSTSFGELEWWDLKKSIEPSFQNRFIISIYPWQADEQLTKDMDSFLGYVRPVFSPFLGIQSVGYAISFSLKRGWSTSSYHTSLKSMALMHYYLTHVQKEPQKFNQLMIQTVELLTKKKYLLDSKFKSLDIFLLGQYTIDESNEVMNAACNLILSQIRKCDQIPDCRIVRELLDLQESIQQSSNDPNSPQQVLPFSNVEVILLMLDTYLSGMNTQQPNEQYKNRVLQGLHLKNCLVNPHLCAPLLKVFSDVYSYFKSTIDPIKLMKNLFLLFFHYNTVLDYSEVLNSQSQQTQFANVLREISRQPDDLKKRMRQLTVKAIIQVAISHPTDFLNILKKDISNLETHILYPTAVIEIIRNYIKSQHNSINKQLPFLMEVILKTLDPNNPHLRKVCVRSATYALHTICKSFKCVCFHQTTQKIAIGDSQIIIYDLRTAVKWRVLDGHSGQIATLEFDHTGKQLASYGQEDNCLKIWKVGSTGFFGAIIGIQGKPTKDIKISNRGLENPSLKWHQDDSKIHLLEKGQPVNSIAV